METKTRSNQGNSETSGDPTYYEAVAAYDRHYERMSPYEATRSSVAARLAALELGVPVSVIDSALQARSIVEAV